MTTALIIVFALLVYTYVLYPILLAVVASLRAKSWKIDESYEPTVSIILSAYNEEAVIERLLNSLLQFDYPRDTVEILIGSDASDDATNSIVERFARAHSNIRFFPFPERRGKMLVLNDLVAHATGEILYFCDADVTLSPNTLRVHTRHYADEQIGGVAGAYQVVSKNADGVFSSERKLVGIESWMREKEAAINSVIGMYGANASMRRSLWEPLPDPKVHDDMFSVLVTITKHLRVIVESGSKCIDEYSRTLTDEFRRKSRWTSYGFSTISYFPEIVSFRRGFPSLFLWSHKILRWLTPWMLLLCGIVIPIHFCSAPNLLWSILLAMECSILMSAVIGAMFYALGKNIALFNHIFWFLVMQLAFAYGTLKFIIRDEQTVWAQPTRDTQLQHSEATHHH